MSETQLCPVCCQAAKPWLEATDPLSGETFPLLRCSSCCHGFIVPPPPDQIGRYYPRGHQTSPPAAYERVDAWVRSRTIRSVAVGRSILDVGCGKGLLLARLRDFGWRVAGTELCESSAFVARTQGVPVHTGPLADCPVAPGTTDVVTFFHSLEHMYAPRRDLVEAHKKLRDGGILIVEVPNFGSWMAHRFHDKWFHLDVPRHIHHFTRESLTLLVKDAGFDVLSVRTHYFLYDVFGAAQSLLNLAFRQKNLLNDLGTKQKTLADVAPQRWKAYAGVAAHYAAFGFSAPFAALMYLASLPIQGGTLRLVARKH